MAATAAALAPVRSNTERAVSDRAAINRANAQHSTGPVTAAGKQASSRNATTHGLFASFQTLSPDDQAAVLAIHDELPYSKITPPRYAHFAFELSLLIFRRERVRALEFAAYAEGVDALCQAENLPEPTSISERMRLEARVFQNDCNSAKVFHRLHSYERAFNREINRLQHELTVVAMNHAEAGLRQADLEARLAVSAAEDAALGAEIDAELASFLQSPSEAPETAEATPRSAPCPCGSGLKYKRCCGKDAPPKLNL